MNSPFPKFRLLTLFFVLVIAVLTRAATGHCDLYIEFLVDGSGSMWAPVRGKAKILLVSKAIERISKDLPPEIAMGLRVYPPPRETGKKDPGLLIPMEKGNRDRFPEELEILNPKGKAPLLENLKRALKDFPNGPDGKLLLLFCDGADTQGLSFCKKERVSKEETDLRFHVFFLNIKDQAEKEELKCLADQLAGSVSDLPPTKNLYAALLPICRNAFEEEVKRQTRVMEEEKKRRALQSKTRLKVEFQNTLDPFFADSVEVFQCHLDGQKIPLKPDVRLVKGESILLLDKAAQKGTHRLGIQYRMWRGEEPITSREGTLEVEVEEGKASSVQCYPQGALLHWGCFFKKKVSD